MNDSYTFRWKLPFHYLLQMITAMVFNLKRNFKGDSEAVIHSNRIKLRISGLAPSSHVHKTVFLINHFSASGFSAFWLAMSIAATIPMDVEWLMTNAWTFPGRRFHRFLRWVSHIILLKIARVYSFFPFPPISGEPSDVLEQGISLRRVFHFIREHPDAVFAIAPEGRDSMDGGMGIPPPGSGLFIKTLIDMGFQLIPLGFFANPKEIHLNFGNPLHLKVKSHLSKQDLDLQIRQQVMQAIEICLPIKYHALNIKE